MVVLIKKKFGQLSRKVTTFSQNLREQLWPDSLDTVVKVKYVRLVDLIKPLRTFLAKGKKRQNEGKSWSLRVCVKCACSVQGTGGGWESRWTVTWLLVALPHSGKELVAQRPPSMLISAHTSSTRGHFHVGTSLLSQETRPGLKYKPSHYRLNQVMHFIGLLMCFRTKSTWALTHIVIL